MVGSRPEQRGGYHGDPIPPAVRVGSRCDDGAVRETGAEPAPKPEQVAYVGVAVAEAAYVIACVAASQNREWLWDPVANIRAWTRVLDLADAATRHLNQTHNNQ